jgi:hypothetical protein
MEPSNMITIHAMPNTTGSDTPRWIDLIPAGTFTGRDGRGPYKNEHPETLIAATRAEGLTAGLPIDFDHATDLGASLGLPAPAAGWIRDFRIVNGVIQGWVEWTAQGAKAVASKAYRYISPVFAYDNSGNIQQILRAALTNNPNLHLTALASAQGGERITMLRREDREICRMTNTSEAAFLAARAKRSGTAIAAFSATTAPAAFSGVFENMVTFARTRSSANLRAAQSCLTEVIGQAAARHLSKTELEICRASMTDPARFALQKKQTASGTAIMMAHDGHVTPMPDSLKPSDCLKSAMQEIQEFLKDPEHLDSLQHLINASAWVREAVKLAGAADRQARGW